MPRPRIRSLRACRQRVISSLSICAGVKPVRNSFGQVRRGQGSCRRQARLSGRIGAPGQTAELFAISLRLRWLARQHQHQQLQGRSLDAPLQQNGRVRHIPRTVDLRIARFIKRIEKASAKLALLRRPPGSLHSS